MRGKAVQIVSINEDAKPSDSFLTYHEESLKKIMKKIPDPFDTTISVVSVVGAFRTGKSFLLSLFLRYLNFHFAGCNDRNVTAADKMKPHINVEYDWKASNLLEDNLDVNNNNSDERNQNSSSARKKWYDTFEKLERDFDWCGGHERKTTGIWMWSEPILYKTKDNKKIALLLMDTQGMFDNKTTSKITSTVFGLSLLISSYQIYNIQNRIQEDHLQHLAFFSEYGRLAYRKREEEENEKKKQALKKEEELKAAAAEAERAAAAARASRLQKLLLFFRGHNHSDDDKASDMMKQEDPDDTKQETSTNTPSSSSPFQTLEFLVRDWQNFKDNNDEKTQINNDDIIKEMEQYLQNVLEQKGERSNLTLTRDQIVKCFDTTCCFLLPHPGMKVTKERYKGEINQVDSLFLQLLDIYCRRVFDINTLPVKQVCGTEVTAVSFKHLIKEYITMFNFSKAKYNKFPNPDNVLEATAKVNNYNAIEMSFARYCNGMDVAAGAGVTDDNVKTDAELELEHQSLCDEAIRIFNTVAKFGSTERIDEARTDLLNKINQEYQRYKESNNLRIINRANNEGLSPMQKFVASFIAILVAVVLKK